MRSKEIIRRGKEEKKIIIIFLIACFLFLFHLSLPLRVNGEAQSEIAGKGAGDGTASTGAKEQEIGQLTLDRIIEIALAQSPKMRITRKEIEGETYSVDGAKALRMPRVDVNGGATRFRYPMPLTPIVISGPLGAGTDIPDFEKTIYDGGFTLNIPLFMGGRLMRGVKIAELKKAIAEDTSSFTRQELIYNLTSVYYKILQLKDLLTANDASVQQLEAHLHDVELFLKTGTVARLDLLKTEVQLSHAREKQLAVQNGLENAYELLRYLMGYEGVRFSVAHRRPLPMEGFCPPVEKAIEKALEKRPDYKAVVKKRMVMEERLKIAKGKRLPEVSLGGEYTGRSGEQFAFKEDWYVGVRFSIPLFDGGLIRSEINRERVELEKVKEEERQLRLTIIREVKESSNVIENARERYAVTEKALESAREALRVERLKYETGAGTTTDVLDAQAALIRAESEYCQALYDWVVAVASMKKATGEEWFATSGLNDRQVKK